MMNLEEINNNCEIILDVRGNNEIGAIELSE